MQPGFEASDLIAQLPYTWPVFFARHGNFTPIQTQAIPSILAGQNTLLVAATAAGKTEAAIAPLLERHILTDSQDRAALPLRLLYICPTRALVRDLYERLRRPLESLGVTLLRKSGDTGPVPTQRPPAVLITTPESTDSLLTRAPRLLATLRAVVLDEIHLFDAGVRGDQLRCALRRIEMIRRYNASEQGAAYRPLQRVALSATVPDLHGIAHRYLQTSTGDAYEIVQSAEKRRLIGQIRPITGSAELVAALNQSMRGRTALRKALVFCNTRRDVEQVAAALREHLSSEAAIFVHYSNLDPHLRREVEEGFAAAPVALCVCTSTLELGIDIGSIDHVALVGPPSSLTSFLQRIGRGGRRSGLIRIIGLARSPLEDLTFQALLDLAQTDATLTAGIELPAYAFRPSVLVQQIFSLLKQSPTGGLRLADLRRLSPMPLEDKMARHLLDHLVLLEYLAPGRPGEWRPGPALAQLVDDHEIYSNIGADPLSAVLVDAFTGRNLAQTDRLRWLGDTLVLGGQTMEVVWRDRYRIGVRPRAVAPQAADLGLTRSALPVSLEVGQAVAHHLGLPPGQLVQVANQRGVWLFHFWGDVYGMLLQAILQALLATPEEPVAVSYANEYAVRLSWELTALPLWDTAIAQDVLEACAPDLEPWLEMGRFQGLLPRDMADAAVIAQCDILRLERLYRAAVIHTPSARLRARLLSLLNQEA